MSCNGNALGSHGDQRLELRDDRQAPSQMPPKLAGKFAP
jgi:hypothetical protein